MADTKEALPVVAWWREWEGDDSDLGSMLFAQDESEKDASQNWAPLTDHATATAAIAELRAEVERYKQARNDIKALHQAQTINNQNYSNHWHEAIDAALEVFDATRSDAYGVAE